MNWFNSIRKLLVAMRRIIFFICFVFTFIFFIIVFNKAYLKTGIDTDINPDLASKFGDFDGGFIGTLFAFLSILIVAYSIWKQTSENRKNTVKATFFQMMDYHYKNLDQIEVPKPERKNVTEKGKRGFVAFKIQLNRLLQCHRARFTNLLNCREELNTGIS